MNSVARALDYDITPYCQMQDVFYKKDKNGSTITDFISKKGIRILHADA